MSLARLRDGNKLTRSIVYEEVFDFLTGPSGPLPEAPVTTTQLMELLWPVHEAHGLALETRKRVIGFLIKDADTFAAHHMAHKGEWDGKRKWMGHAVRPWLWHAPAVQSLTCPKCGERFDVV